MGMTIMSIIGAVILCMILWRMQKAHVSFTKRVFFALFAGIAYGALLQAAFGSGSEVVGQANAWVSIIGSGYVRLLNMIVVPLIFVAISSAIVGQDSETLKKSAGYILLVLMVTVAISALVGGLFASWFGLSAQGLVAGEKEAARTQQLTESLKDYQAKPIPVQLTEIIPKNIFYALSGQGGNATLSVVFFAAFLGMAILGMRKRHGDSAALLTKLLQALNDLVMRMVTMVLRFTPYGVLALMISFVSTSPVEGILKLVRFVAANYAAMAVMFLIHLAIIALFGLNPVQFVKKSFETLAFAFTSRSSAGTLPINIKSQEQKLGVPSGTANLAATLGASIGQNGCAGIYPAMLAVMIATSQGIPMDAGFFLRLIFITALSSLGIAGVGGGATFAALAVLSAMGLPVGLVGLLIAIEPLIDMGRTALNVSDSMVAGVVSARLAGDLDRARYDAPDAPLVTE